MKKLYSLILLSTLLLTHLQASSQQTQTTPESTDLAVASSLSDKVVELFRAEKFKEALPLAKRALEIRERLLPANDPRIEAALLYLGDVQLALRDHGDAKGTFERLLQKQEQRLGPQGADLALTLDRLCIASFSVGSFDTAEGSCKRALAIKEVSLGQKHPEVAHSLYMLGEQYRLRRYYRRAAPFYSRAIAIYSELPDEPNLQVRKAYDGFTCLCYESEEKELLEELEKIRSKYVCSPKDVVEESRILNGRALYIPKPDYPREALVAREEGMVLVRVLIDKTGKVVNASDLCQGPPALSRAAINAARMARFTPTKLSGMPVQVYGQIIYNFRR